MTVKRSEVKLGHLYLAIVDNRPAVVIVLEWSNTGGLDGRNLRTSRPVLVTNFKHIIRQVEQHEVEHLISRAMLTKNESKSPGGKIWRRKVR